MPIAFPLPRRGALFYDPKQMLRKPFYVEPVPNTAQPGTPISASMLSPGVAFSRARQKQKNVRNLGSVYKNVTANSYANPMGKARTDLRFWGRVLVYSGGNQEMRGISRDSAGSALGSCRVLLFRTEDNSFVKETTSDGSGNWVMSVMSAGSFFVVYYKAGGTDLAGTTKNTLTTVQGDGGA